MEACRHFLKVSQSFSSCQSLYEVVHMVDEVFEENLWTFFVGGMNLKGVGRSVKNLLEAGIFLKLSGGGNECVMFLATPDARI